MMGGGGRDERLNETKTPFLSCGFLRICVESRRLPHKGRQKKNLVPMHVCISQMIKMSKQFVGQV